MKLPILKLLVLFSVVLPFHLQAQMKPLDKVYIIEGIVADKETLEVIQSAIIFNDTFGITTTSDENGYFKLVVPYNLVKDRALIPIDILRKGYKRNGWGIGSVHLQKDIATIEGPEVWRYDVPILLMAKNESTENSTSMAHIPAKENEHGYPMIKQTFEQAVFSERRYRKLEQLKKGNEQVYFDVDGWIMFSTRSSSAYLDSVPLVFVDGEKIELSILNNKVKRSLTKIDWKESEALENKLGKRVVAFRTGTED